MKHDPMHGAQQPEHLREAARCGARAKTKSEGRADRLRNIKPELLARIGGLRADAVSLVRALTSRIGPTT
jgi:hypothetical protein